MKRKLRLIGAIALLCSLYAGFVAMSDPAPVIQITKTATNIFQIGITNGTNTGYYELYHSPVLGDAAYPFALLQVGTMGQTNFSVTNFSDLTGFYFIGVGNDWDGDGIPNSSDANPTSTNFGALTIMIDSPTNHATFN